MQYEAGKRRWRRAHDRIQMKRSALKGEDPAAVCSTPTQYVDLFATRAFSYFCTSAWISRGEIQPWASQAENLEL